MKHLKSFKIFESLIEENQISIEQFLIEIRIPSNKIQQIVEWWSENRGNMNIYYFPFIYHEIIMLFKILAN